MAFRNRIKGLANIVKSHPIKSVLAAGLLALVSTTALKDNVHFVGGSLTINNPDRNHYVWGIISFVNISGEGEGNIRTYAIIAGTNTLQEDSSLKGNMFGYGLLGGGNTLRRTSRLEGNMLGLGLIGINELNDNASLNGNSSCYGIALGMNVTESGATIRGDVKTTGIICKTPEGLGLITRSSYNLNYTDPRISEKEE